MAQRAAAPVLTEYPIHMKYKEKMRFYAKPFLVRLEATLNRWAMGCFSR
jgi:hypothetical protein